MTSLDEKAQETPEVSLARQSAPGAYRLESLELVGADTVSPEGEFPEYGEFLETTNSAGSTEYVECPQHLAALLVDQLEAEEGTVFRIVSVQKVDGAWQYEVEEIEESDDTAGRFYDGE
jgi:hypothetical protein